MAEAELLWAHAIDCAEHQRANGRRFVILHPVNATSWKHERALQLREHPDVRDVIFDQCVFGLCTKVNRVPVRKRTRLLSNCPRIIARFKNCLCRGGHFHEVLQGVEGGVKRLRHAQIYPDPLVNALLSCV